MAQELNTGASKVALRRLRPTERLTAAILARHMTLSYPAVGEWSGESLVSFDFVRFDAIMLSH